VDARALPRDRRPPRQGAPALRRLRLRLPPVGRADRDRIQRGRVDRAAAGEPARARLSAGAARAPRHLRRLHRPDGGAGGGGRSPRDPEPAWGEGRGAGRRRALDRGRGRRLHRRELDLGSAGATRARPEPRRSGRGLRVRAPAPRGAGRLEQGGRLLEVRARDPRERVAARLGHGWQRGDLRAQALGLRRGRSQVRSRPRAAVPHGAARAARGLRARGARLGAAHADERVRVPAQGADVRARLADRAARAHAAPGYFVALVSHRHLRYASGLLHLVLLGSSLALLGQGTIYAVFLALQLGTLLAALVGVGIPRYYVLISWATVVALWNYLRRGVPATWAPQREELA
jgi:hypothetical protein